MSEALAIRAEGRTDRGSVRSQNEDNLLVDAALGTFAVFDGMGGHHAGEIASACARDAFHAHLREAAAAHPLEQADVVEALQRASAAVHDEAKRLQAKRGIGTTAVVCQILAGGRAVVAHAGDSRAYLVREGRLYLLTVDHTIVAELVAKGAITPEEAQRHPYRSVLSRNLGAHPHTRPDTCPLQLVAGDRVLLCSDGLTGFVDHHAIEQCLRAAVEPRAAVEELINRALEGGGGDNVTAIVIEAGRPVIPARTQVIRTSGAEAWWGRRDAFLAEAARRGVARSPLCALLSADEAVGIVAGNVCEAIYRDLEQSTGIHVWTFADKLAAGWFDQGGAFAEVVALLDQLRAAADAVIAGLVAEDAATGALLAVAVPRALMVAEIAVGGLVARRLREVEAEIAAVEATRPDTITDAPTIPVAPPRTEPPTPELARCLAAASREASREAAGGADAADLTEALGRAHEAALEHGGALDAPLAAREVFHQRALGEASVGPLLDALERARRIHVGAVRRARDVPPEVRVEAVARLLTAHRQLTAGVAELVVELGRPIADQLKEVADRVSGLRRKVAANEIELSTHRRKREGTQPGWPAPVDHDDGDGGVP